MKYVSISKHSEDKFRRDYIREHAKFIHSSYLLEEDLDKEVELHGKKFRIAGLWDIIGYKKEILLQVVETGGYAHTDSKEVAAALGFNNFRNFVTGKEITYDLSAVFRYNQMLNRSKIEPILEDKPADDTEDQPIVTEEDTDFPVHERDKEYISEDEEEITEVDPLVKALQKTEDDGGWVDETE
jgi:hypothetical protein